MYTYYIVCIHISFQEGKLRIEKKIESVTRLIKKNITKELVSEDITGKQYFILGSIEELGEITPAKLADTIKRDRSTVAEIVRKLIAKGLLEKKKNISDGRSYTVSPTEESREQRIVMKEKKEKGVNKVFSHLTREETELLNNILDKIIAGGENIEGDE